MRQFLSAPSRQAPVFSHLSAEREPRPPGPYYSSSLIVLRTGFRWDKKRGSSEWPRAHLDFSVGSTTDDARDLHICHGPCL